MEIKTVELTEVTLPDGSKAWFERRETAERICKVVDMLSDIALEARADILEPHKRSVKIREEKKSAPKAKQTKNTREDSTKKPSERKPRMYGKVEGVPTEEECRHVEKMAKKSLSAKITTHKLDENANITNEKKEQRKPESTNARGYSYAERACDICGNTFKPRSGRQKVCEECRNAGLDRKRNREKSKENNQAKEEKVSDALAEVRKHAKEAGLGPYKN